MSRFGRHSRWVWVVLVLGLAGPASASPPLPKQTPPGAAVASAHPLATAAGIEMLAAGGNAFDAAVAVSATLAVVEPYSSGLGGGGFWLLYDADTSRSLMLDGRERAPLSAGIDLLLDENGEYDRALALDTARGSGIPGMVAALDWLATERARFPLARLLAPAIRAAEQGFEVTEHFLTRLEYRIDVLRESPAGAVFLVDGEPPALGARIVQPDLAATLRAVAESGRDGFYLGPVAEALVTGANARGADWSLQDLAGYEVALRIPQTFTYRDIAITTASLPSSGGVVLAETLAMLEAHDFEELSDPDQRHLALEAMRRAYRDRALYLGDPDFVQVPVAELTAPYYLARLGADIDLTRATPSAELAPPTFSHPASGSGTDTTHFSIIDANGNRVAATLSINTLFGSGQMPPGTGVLLNNELDDFAPGMATPNAWGLVGGRANQVEASKRPLSSMSPTFLDDGARVAVLGTPGGSRIISMVLLGILDFSRGGSAASMVSRPRFHHQYLPDVVQFEQGALSAPEQADLLRRGHTLKELGRTYGNMQAVVWDRVAGTLRAAADPRGEGAAAVIELPRPRALPQR